AVRATDAVGNVGDAAMSVYVLDTTAPVAPEVEAGPPASTTDPTVTFTFIGEPGASLQCRLLLDGTVVSDWTACSSPTTYDLTGQPAGMYPFEVRAIDPAGNVGSVSAYSTDRVHPVTAPPAVVAPAEPPPPPPPPPSPPPPVPAPVAASSPPTPPSPEVATAAPPKPRPTHVESPA